MVNASLFLHWLEAIGDNTRIIISGDHKQLPPKMCIRDSTIPLIIKLSQFEDIICQGIDEPMLAIENISLTIDCFKVFGKSEDTISFMVNDIKYIQFKCKEGNQLYDFLQNAWDDNDSIIFNIVGKPSINEYNGIRTPQIIIEDVAVISTNSNDEDDDW